MEKGMQKFSDRSEGQGSGPFRSANPLLFDLILDKVFNYLLGDKCTSASIKDVQTFRLVCSLWRNRATSIFRKWSSELTLTSDKGKIFGPDIELMTQFLKVMKNSSFIPLNKYSINVRNATAANSELMEDFIRVCLPQATQLRLKFDDFTSVKWTTKAFSHLKLRFPTLKILEIEFEFKEPNLYPPPSPKHGHLSPLVGLVFKLAKNLEQVELTISNLTSTLYLKYAEDLVSKIGGSLPKIVQSLRLNNMCLLDSLLASLLESNINLRKFSLWCVPIFCSQMSISSFFEQQSDSLKILCLQCKDMPRSFLQIFSTLCDDSTSLITPEFPQLKRLERLHFSRANCAPLSIPTTFPALIELDASQLTSSSTWEEMISNSEKVISVRELHLPDQEIIPQSDLIEKVSQCLPNVKILTVTASFKSVEGRETMRNIFTYFLDVEELTIRISNNVDYFANITERILSGVDSDTYDEIMKERETEFENVDSLIFARKPSILNLTKLKKLTLCGSTFESLTDFAVHFVLLKMPSLKELRMPKLGPHSLVSSKYRNLLESKMRVVETPDANNSHLPKKVRGNFAEERENSDEEWDEFDE